MLTDSQTKEPQDRTKTKLSDGIKGTDMPIVEVKDMWDRSWIKRQSIVFPVESAFDVGKWARPIREEEGWWSTKLFPLTKVRVKKMGTKLSYTFLFFFFLAPQYCSFFWQVSFCLVSSYTLSPSFHFSRFSCFSSSSSSSCDHPHLPSHPFLPLPSPPPSPFSFPWCHPLR